MFVWWQEWQSKVCNSWALLSVIMNIRREPSSVDTHWLFCAYYGARFNYVGHVYLYCCLIFADRSITGSRVLRYSIEASTEPWLVYRANVVSSIMWELLVATAWFSKVVRWYDAISGQVWWFWVFEIDRSTDIANMQIPELNSQILRFMRWRREVYLYRSCYYTQFHKPELSTGKGWESERLDHGFVLVSLSIYTSMDETWWSRAWSSEAWIARGYLNLPDCETPSLW